MPSTKKNIHSYLKKELSPRRVTDFYDALQETIEIAIVNRGAKKGFFVQWAEETIEAKEKLLIEAGESFEASVLKDDIRTIKKVLQLMTINN